MTRLLVGFPLLILLVGCGSTPVVKIPLARQQAISANHAAASASGQGQWRVALGLWRETARLHAALDDWSAVGWARLAEAQALAQLEKSEEAISTLTQFRNDPRYPAEIRARAHFQLAVLLAGAGRWPESLANVEASESLIGKDDVMLAATSNLRARVALANGDWGAGLRYTEKALGVGAVEANERANALRLQGRAHLGERNWSAASFALEQALALDRQLARPAAIAADLMALAEAARGKGDEGASELMSRAEAVCAAQSLPSCQHQ